MKRSPAYRIQLPSKAGRTLPWLFFGLLLLLISCEDTNEPSRFLEVQEFPERREDFSLWQLEQFFFEAQMGYILRTDDQKIVVIDSGTESATSYLEAYIRQLGGIVDTWVITHPHVDHVGALLGIMERGHVEIRRLLHSALRPDWVRQHEPESAELIARYYRALEGSGIEVIDMRTGETSSLGEGVTLKVLGDRNEDILINAVNNSSLAFKVTSKSKSVLFLGDLGEEGGNRMLQQHGREALQSLYVQMAHHGQDGVTKDFYAAVQADYALWPTPKWLWNNQLEGQKVNSGTWKTLIVREWMEELHVKRNYVSGLDGTVQID